MHTHKNLKEKHRIHRDQNHPNASIRIHRALSWLKKAEQEPDDDGRFVFYWIAFNAAYGQDLPSSQHMPQSQLYQQFIERLCENDKVNKLHNILWQQYPKSIRILLNNHYVFQPFWNAQNTNDKHSWKTHFKTANQIANTALGKNQTAQVITIIMERLYTLRNQIIHGGATYQSQINRAQIKDAVAIMADLIPALVDIMIDTGHQIWGDPAYPVADV